MDVLKLKHVGDIFFVQYEENKDTKTLKTEDEPASELISAMDNVALCLLKLFNVAETPAKLQEIVWKDGDKAGSKCVLLSGESQFGQFKIALPKVSSQEAETPRKEYTIPGNKKTSTTRLRTPSAKRRNSLSKENGNNGPCRFRKPKPRRNGRALSARRRTGLPAFSVRRLI
jgi:hypothetical protein